MTADSRDGLLASRPVGPDVGRVIKQGPAHHRVLSLIVDSFRHDPGTLPLLAAWRGQRAELGPRESADIALADRVPVLLMDHLADRGGGKTRRPAIHRCFRHRILVSDAVAAGLV